MAQLLETTVYGSLTVSGNILPTAHGSYALGSTNSMWASVYAAGIYNPLSTGILTLSGTGGVVISASNGQTVEIYGSTNIYGGRLLLIDTDGVFSLYYRSNRWTMSVSGITGLEINNMDIVLASSTTLNIASHGAITYAGDVIHKMYCHRWYLSYGSTSIFTAGYLLLSTSDVLTRNTFYTALSEFGANAANKGFACTGGVGAGYKPVTIYVTNTSFAYAGVNRNGATTIATTYLNKASGTFTDNVIPLF